MSRVINIVLNGLVSLVLMLSSIFIGMYFWGYWPDLNQLRGYLPSGTIVILGLVLAAVFSLGVSIAWQTFSYYRDY